MPEISVIIPNYNHARYLKQRIDSVLEQTFQDFELIILDDCSTDNSKEIIERYRNHPKTKHIIYNENNSGSVFRQWIKGFSLAEGKYIWIAESDDFASNLFLEKTLAVMEEDSETGTVFTTTQMVDEKSELIKKDQAKDEAFQKLKTYHNTIDKNNLTHFLFKQLLIQNASGVLFRTAALDSVALQDISQFTNTGDRFVYIGIALNFKIKYLENKLNFMRSHRANTTKKSFQNGKIYKDRLKIFNYYLEKLYLDVEAKKNLQSYFNYNFVWFVDFCSYKDVMLLIKQLRAKKILDSSFIFYKIYTVFFKKISPFYPDRIKGFVESFLYKI